MGSATTCTVFTAQSAINVFLKKILFHNIVTTFELFRWKCMGLIGQGLKTMTSWKLGQRLLEKCVFLWLSHRFLSLFLSVFLSSSNRVGLSIVKMKRLSFPFEPLYTFSLSLSSLFLSSYLCVHVCVSVYACVLARLSVRHCHGWIMPGRVSNYQHWLPSYVYLWFQSVSSWPPSHLPVFFLWILSIVILKLYSSLCFSDYCFNIKSCLTLLCSVLFLLHMYFKILQFRVVAVPYYGMHLL